jgi:4-methyl-5(b-hydroxyethyl)-thiazole monophosphate biosynthesis
MSKALVPLAKGFEDIEAVAVIDILRRGGVEVVTAAIGPSLDVESAHGIVMKAETMFGDVADDEYDAIVLPGGGEGTDNLKNSDALIKRLVRQREEEKLLCAICAAPTVLQEAGLLDLSQHVTCYPTCQMDVNCNWVNEPVVSHNGIITGRAPGSATIFALVVLEALEGHTIAHKVARGLVFDF